MIADWIADFIADPGCAGFEELALEVIAFQYQNIPSYRRLCDSEGRQPGRLQSWEEAPTVPTLAFKTLELRAAKPVETFRSSGTGGTQSTHFHAYPELYRKTIDASFGSACLGSLQRPPMLSLVPTRDQDPASSLGFMVDHILSSFGAADSATAFGRQGVEKLKVRSFLSARQRDRRPALVLATSFALAEVVDALERQNLHFRLPPGSVIFETGGYKGVSKELARGELLDRIEVWLGVQRERVVREYGMTELTSQFYTQGLEGGDADRFVAPHWTRVRILDPETLTEAPSGSTGLISIFDLANVGSAAHLLTQDLGTSDELGFRLVGRADGADLRGCSLTVEQLAGYSPGSPTE